MLHCHPNGIVTTTSDLATNNDNYLKSESLYDGLGRTYETRRYEDSTNYIKTTQTFDALGRTKRSYNPHRTTSDSTYGYAENTYDALGRVTAVTTSDSAVVSTYYLSNTVTVTDQAGKSRKSFSDALGRLSTVVEPDSYGSLNLNTSYTYDALNNLTQVNQGSQTRTFAYDSLSRLTSAANPESGTITYSYDGNGNLTGKTDARSISTSYTYDSLNRATFRDYSDSTPDVTYTYENGGISLSNGKLTKVSNSNSTTEYTGFDVLGRVTAHKQTTGGTAYITGYTYNLAGALLEETYPSGRVVKNTITNYGDLSQVETKPSGGSYATRASNFVYTAPGAASSLQLGNGKYETTSFNSRLQPTQIGLGTSTSDTSLLKLEYGYGTTANNGNVLTQKITVPGVTYAFEQAYSYDTLNRLASATETYNGAQTWTQSYGFDRYGNRNITAGTGTTSLTFGASNNRITTSGYTYDNAGNTTADPSGKSFVYDAENKQTSVSNGGTLGTYYYDGDGKRVKKTSSSDNIIFIYAAAGTLIEERNLSGALQTSYVYAGGRLLSTETSSATNYLTADHLGSPRINTDGSGNVTARHDYLPFGEEIFSALTAQRTSVVGYAGDSVRKQFTGYERDTESDLDFAQARYYNSMHGRFTSVDPLRASAKAENPQTWNRYSYTMNNPLSFVDPTGLVAMDDYYVERDGFIIVKDTEDSFYRFFVQDKDSPNFTQVAQLERNAAGLVQFPDSGGSFDRYGTVDAGGTDRKVGETVGQGDHFVQPGVAAALFGLTTVLNQDYGITLSLGDMSSSSGSDPWEPSMANKTKNNGHHGGHGHFGSRTGLDVDFRYVNGNGVSFQSTTATTDNQFSQKNNQTVYDAAEKFGFTANYQGTNGKLGGVKRVDGHNDHGHLGMNPAKGVFRCSPGAGGICN